jgi:hypothetical protein
MRPSLGERERVASRLRGACAEDRLSLDTFSRRLDIAYTARSRDELEWLVADLPEPNTLMRAALTAVTAISRWSSRLEQAWRVPRTQRFTLPTHRETIVGRSRSSGCVLADETVSRTHAVVSYADGTWSVRDLGSTNGTYVNGLRISEETRVRPGDEIAFGGARFVLA